MSEQHLLVIDDEQAQRDTLAGFLRKQGYSVSVAANGQEGLEQARKNALDLVITDLRMPVLGGLELLSALREEQPHLGVIIVTAYGDMETVVAAMRAGAFTFLAKPLDLDQLLVNIERALERRTLIMENASLKEALSERSSIEGIIAGSGEMEEVLNLVARVGPSRASILLLGESGTGKERVARAIHRSSPRAEEPFVPVNMAAMPESLVESELFGHELGAFTGAQQQRRGLFEEANGGTLFIDEVGDIPLPVQVKLLRVLQESCINRVGGNEQRPVDVRVVAATHQDLEALIREGRFREDLYYRLNVIAIQIPPLRRRRADIPPLLEHFIERFAAMNDKAVGGVDRDALDLLMKYPYPGNVRELENAVERAVVLARGRSITAEDLPMSIRAGESPLGRAATPEASLDRGSLHEQVEKLERALVEEALSRGGGNKSEAARLLGLTEKNVRDRLKRWGSS
jgi:DNA-binding NtrC family response regulator